MFVYKAGLDHLLQVMREEYEKNMATYERVQMIEMLRAWMFHRPGTTSRQLQILDLAMNEPLFLAQGTTEVNLDGQRYRVTGSVVVEDVPPSDPLDSTETVCAVAREYVGAGGRDFLTYVVDAQLVRRIWMEFRAPRVVSLARIGQIARYMFRSGAYAEGDDDDYVLSWRVEEIRRQDESVPINPKASVWQPAEGEWQVDDGL